MATVRGRIRDNMLEEWRTEWNESRIANHAKTFYRGPNPGKARFVYKLSRFELGRFERIITGHNNLNFFQNKLGLCASAMCRLCGESFETVSHFLYTCPRLVAARDEIFLGETQDNNMRWSVRDLINFSYTPGINEAFEGTWTSGDPHVEPDRLSDVSFGLEWLDDSLGDENNNSQTSQTMQ